MKSKEEITRLVAALAGALGGVAIGLGVLMVLWQLFPALSTSGGLVPMVVIIALCGGGLLGGGYVGLWLASRKQRTARRKYFEDKKKRKKARK
jgi:hypothetical protein